MCCLDYSEKLLWRSRVFRTVLYLVRIKNIKQVRVTYLQGLKRKKKKEQTSMYTRESLRLSYLGRGSLSSKESQ